MNTHKNARLSYARRVELVLRAAQPFANHTDLGREFGVCRQTVRKWLQRYLADGLGGLCDRSSRPQHSPTRLRRTPRRQIERRRRQRHSSPRIARELGLPLSTVVREQRRLGLNRLRRLDPPRPAHRYEWPAAGDLLHLDIKKLGQIGGRVGHRMHGDRTTRVRGIAVARVMTDNGSAYRSRRFAAVVAQHQVRHLRTRPYTPRTNGKAERFIRTLLAEWAYAQAYRTSLARTAALPHYLGYYNTARPHMGINGQTPRQKFAAL